eukprot:jgi/Psemu1/12032/gm1.12032_g
MKFGNSILAKLGDISKSINNNVKQELNIQDVPINIDDKISQQDINPRVPRNCSVMEQALKLQIRYSIHGALGASYTLISNSKMDTPASGRQQRQSMQTRASTMESDNADTPIAILQIGRNKSSGNISSLPTTSGLGAITRFTRSCPVILLHHKADDGDKEDADKADNNATMMLTHNNELDRDGGDSDEEGSLAADFDVQTGCNNSKDKDKDKDKDNADGNNNNGDELHVGVKDGYYYYKDGTQVEETTTYPKPPQDYTPSDNNKSELGEPAWHNVDNPSDWERFCYQLCYQLKFGSLIWQSLGSTDFNLEQCLSGMFYSSTSSSSLSKKTINRQTTHYGKSPLWRKNYANQANTGKGHYVKRIELSELVHFDGIVYLHGGGPIKSNLKLNCNNEAKYSRLLCKDDMSKFNYAYKVDYIYETLVHSVHHFSKKACSELCMDESSWGLL